ncbi:MAG: phosphoribosylglycinamide formyltransferase [bacterium]|nr:phosphoribosylglycinamide formyltransferase [bacterium]
MQTKRIAIFASGTGSNAINLIRFFQEDADIEVAFVLSNKAEAKVLSSAQELGVKTLHFDNQQVADGTFLVGLCKEHRVDWIVLAGYLRLIPAALIQAYDRKMINLHPSLLPNYGGKGMHGRNVHEAVIANGEEKSGITIHFVNEEFDKGEILAQFHCKLTPEDTVESLEGKIRYLEQTYLPTVVRGAILNQ